MALKKKITKAEFEKLADHFKSEYIEDGDGYRLDVDGEEDTGALKRAKDRESQLRKDAEKRAKEAEEKLASLEGDDARKKGDIATLEKAWQKKIDDAESAAKLKIDKLTDYTKKSLVDTVASAIASKISTSPALLLPHIKQRLQADFDGDEPKTTVLDKTGKPSSLTIEELSNEFVANKDFSAIIIASKGSGSAGDKSRKAGGQTSQSNDDKKDLSTLNPRELADFLKSQKENKDE